ncbi:MAG: Gfo/Idh/MocA family oxidoreductase [Planctomycetes bacterium]|nr:Gfo/Idh/MocA family oxidoreductase [Planctomycetota bacterium]
MKPTRRTFFLQMGAAAALPAGLRAARPTAAAEKLNIAGIGCGGKGWSDIAETSKDQNVVALCDVDSERLDKAKQRWTGAKTYADWRKLLEQRDVDAVTISTPDHMHAAIAMTAMALGKHVYCQKPLTHDIFEARQLRLMAERSKVVNQMGNQHRSTRNYRGARDLITTGVIGAVREVHSWTDRPIWPQGMDRPRGEDPVPQNLDWDLWIGTAPMRPFKNGVYHAFAWRGFWDFGTGALGDMGCHLMDPAVWSLGLTAPTRVEAFGPKPHGDTAPRWAMVAYDFPARGTLPPVRMYWYDGGMLPPAHITKWPADKPLRTNGCLFVGEKGNLYVDGGFGPILLPEEQWKDFAMPEFEETDHYMNWTNACKGQGACISPFSEAGPLTEAVLLGNVAYRLGMPIEWDAEELAVTNARVAAAPLLRREYRRGWEVRWVD